MTLHGAAAFGHSMSRWSCCIAASLLTGCTVSAPPTRIALVGVETPVPPYTIVKREVVGVDCPAGDARLGDYGRALANAIASAPTANALVNVELRSMPRGLPPKICLEVRGDAAKL